MKISRGFALSCLLTVAASPVFAAGFSLGDVANAVSGAQGSNNKAAAAAPSSETAGLLSALTSQLNITPEQAVGGTGAMLGLAKNKLSGTDYSQLGKSVPGLDQLSGSNSLGSLGALSGMLGQAGAQQTGGLRARRRCRSLVVAALGTGDGIGHVTEAETCGKHWAGGHGQQAGQGKTA